MGNQIDEMIDSMSPVELQALEVELDKKSSESQIAYYRGVGVKMARDAWEKYVESGELTPELTLVKAAGKLKNLSPEDQAKFKANKKNPPGPAGGPGVAVKHSDAEIDAELAKCSEEQLAEIEATLDKELADKQAYESAATYYNMGVKMAQEHWAKNGKEGTPKEASSFR
jgi:hypothetical protein